MLGTILERIDSRHFASLWLFYRDYFSSDDECLHFMYNALHREPLLRGRSYRLNNKTGMHEAADGTKFHDSIFIPRRMLNAVERLVSAARDMEQIRKGKDIFKIVFLITCAETLQGLANADTSGKQGKSQLLSFFEENTSDADKAFIAARFFHDDEDSEKDGSKDSFKQFIAVLNEYRNCAAHEGDYWDYCFTSAPDDCPTLLVVNIDLENYSKKNRREHCFQTSIHYKEFEGIFVRICVTFIQNYVEKAFPAAEAP